MPFVNPFRTRHKNQSPLNPQQDEVYRRTPGPVAAIRAAGRPYTAGRCRRLRSLTVSIYTGLGGTQDGSIRKPSSSTESAKTKPAARMFAYRAQETGNRQNKLSTL